MKWTYKIELFDQMTSRGYKGVEQELNIHGEDGWELDRFLQLGDFEYAVFKKPVAES